ncbi:MAG: response regulator transcription factor [Vicingaceae bacterium]|jgi:two-component system response regulator DegU
MNKIRLAIADDQLLFRRGLLSLLKDYEELEVIIEACNGKDLLEQLKGKSVDLVITDLEMPIMDGIEATEHIKKKYPDTKILALTMHNEDSFVVHLIEKGVNGFLLKDYDIELIVDAIHSVMETGYYLNDRVSKAMVKALVRAKQIIPTFNNAQLTKRELELIELLSKEFTTKEIAVKLFVSKRTVEGHRERAMQKVGAKNVVGLIMYAVKHNLID